MENDFRMAWKRFWNTIWRLRRGRQCTVNLLNPTDTSSSEEAGPGDLGAASHIWVEVAEVVNKLLSDKEPGVDEIRLELLNCPSTK